MQATRTTYQTDEMERTLTEQLHAQQSDIAALQPSLNQLREIQEQGLLAEVAEASRQLEKVRKGLSWMETLLEQAELRSETLHEILGFCRTQREAVKATAVTVTRHAKDIRQTLATIKQMQAEMAESRQLENIRLFVVAAQQLRAQHSLQRDTVLNRVISAETQDGLKAAQTILDDFCGRMNEAQKPIPPAIQDVLAEIRQIQAQFQSPLPEFEPPQVLSPRAYGEKQVQEMVADIQNRTAPYPKSYRDYLQQEYTDALMAYAEQLDQATEPPDLNADDIHQRFPDLAVMLLDAFDQDTAADSLMQQIITYYHQRVIPHVLNAFGFDERDWADRRNREFTRNRRSP